MALAARSRVMRLTSISMPKVWVYWVCSFRPAAAFPARPVCAFWAVSRPASTFITLPGRKVNGFFLRKKGGSSAYTCAYGRRKTEKKPVFFFAGRAHPPPGTAARKPAGNPPETHPEAAARPPETHPEAAARPTGHTAARKPAAANRANPAAGSPPPTRRAHPPAGARPHFGALLCKSPVPGEGVARSLGVPGGDRAAERKKSPTNSGRGV